MNIYVIRLRLAFKTLVLAGCLGSLASCASSQKLESERQTDAPIAQQEINVDIEGLKRSLGLDRSRMALGYEEKRFNTCEAGFGYPRQDCKLQVFVSINFRLQCRDSSGTTSEIVTSAQMTPIANKRVRWKIGNSQSTITTDDEGYGQVNGIFSPAIVPRASRLKLTAGSQFVYLRAGEITRVVTPSNWCSSN